MKTEPATTIASWKRTCNQRYIKYSVVLHTLEDPVRVEAYPASACNHHGIKDWEVLGVLHTLKVRPARPMDGQALGCDQEWGEGGREDRRGRGWSVEKGLPTQDHRQKSQWHTMRTNSRLRTWSVGETVFYFAFISVLIFHTFACHFYTSMITGSSKFHSRID